MFRFVRKRAHKNNYYDKQGNAPRHLSNGIKAHSKLLNSTLLDEVFFYCNQISKKIYYRYFLLCGYINT